MQNLIVIDTETTGLDPETCELCEIAAVHLTQRGQGEYFSTMHDINADEIPAQASAVHHLVKRDLAGYPVFSESAFKQGIAEHYGISVDESVIPVAHNARFDAGFVDGTNGSDWLCTARLAKRLLPDAPGYSNQVLRYYLKLDDAVTPADRHLLEILAPHRALYDAVVTAYLLDYLLGLYWNETGDERLIDIVDFCWQPIRLRGRVGFGKHANLKWDELPTGYVKWMATKNDWDIDQTRTISDLLK